MHYDPIKQSVGTFLLGSLSQMQSLQQSLLEHIQENPTTGSELPGSTDDVVVSRNAGTYTTNIIIRTKGGKRHFQLSLKEKKFS